MWLFGLPSDENQPEQTITHPCKVREGRDGLASSCLDVPGVGYGPGADGPDKEGGNKTLLGRGCAREWECESRRPSVGRRVVSCRVPVQVEVWGRNGLAGSREWGNGEIGSHRHNRQAGTRAKSWPPETSLTHNCLQSQNVVCIVDTIRTRLVNNQRTEAYGGRHPGLTSGPTLFSIGTSRCRPDRWIGSKSN
jgi:hypothetical protein